MISRLPVVLLVKAILLLSASVVVAQEQEVLKFDFNNGADGWGFAALHGERAVSGGRGNSAAATVNTSAEHTYASAWKDVPNRDLLRPGAVYRFSGWVRAADESQQATVRLVIKYYDMQNKSIQERRVDEPLEPGDGWKNIGVSLQVPFEKIKNMVLYMQVVGRPTPARPAKAYFDDLVFSMEKAPPPLAVVGERYRHIQVNQAVSLNYRADVTSLEEGQGAPQFEAHIYRLDTGGNIERRAPIAASLTARQLEPLRYQLQLNVPPLVQGSYALLASYRQANQRHEANTPMYLFAYPPPQRPEHISEQGVISRNGKPFFIIGMYHPVNHPAYNKEVTEGYDIVQQMRRDYKLLTENGFNTIQGNNTSDTDFVGQTLDIAGEAGLAVDVPLYYHGAVAKNRDSSLEKLQRFKNHPAVLSWKILDEPELRPDVAHQIPDVYAALSAVGAQAPISLTLCQDNELHFWNNFGNMLKIDRYPLPHGALTTVSNFTRAAKKSLRPWQNLSYVVQCGWTPDMNTQPNVPQARSMAYLALIEGAKGIWWYSMYDPEWNLTKTPLWPHMKAINSELMEISQPVLLGEHLTEVKGDNPQVLFRALKHDNKLFILMTNPGNAPQTIRLTLPPSLKVANGRTLSGKKVEANAPLAFEAIDTQTVVFDLD